VTSHIENVLGDASVNSPGKTYGFRVVAFNGKGETSSAVVNHTVATALPLAPTGLTASNSTPGSTGSQITLNWNDNATNEAGFEIWRYGPISVDGVAKVYNGLPPLAIVGGAQFNAANGGVPSTTDGPLTPGAPTTGPNTYVDVDAELLPRACYNYQVRAVTNNVDVSTWALAPSAGCTIAAAPTVNLTATPASGTRVDLTWTSSASAATSFAVKRNGATLGTVAKTAATTYTFADTTAQAGTTYTYTVEATGTNPLVVGTTTATTPAVPAAPTALLTVPTTTQITVSWTDNAGNEDGFVLERSDNGGTYLPIPAVGAFLPPAAAVAPSTVSYVDTAVLQGVVYLYRVKAIHLVNGSSGYAVSQPVSLLALPMAPSNFAATLSTNLGGTLPSVTLTWLDNATNELGINLQRRTGACNVATGWGNPTSAPAVAGTGGNGAVTYTNVTANNSYCYRIQSTNAIGQSAWVTVAVTVPAIPATPSAPTVNGATTTSLNVTPAGTLTNVIGYQVRYRVGNNGNWTTLPAVAGTVASTIIGLSAGTTSQVQVKTATAGGWSTNWSNPTNGTALRPPPVANADAVSVNASTVNGNQTIQTNVLVNDQNVPNSNRTVTGGAVTKTTAVSASVACNNNGSCTLSLGSTGNTGNARALSRRGTYTYTYTVTVNGQSAQATVTVTVN
jgi:titin